MDSEEVGKTFSMGAEFQKEIRKVAGQLDVARAEQAVMHGIITRDPIGKCPQDITVYAERTDKLECQLDDLILDAILPLIAADGIATADLISTATLYGGRLVHVTWMRHAY